MTISNYFKIGLLAAASISLYACNGTGSDQASTAKNDIKFIDKNNMDTTVRPGDDFFQYANGQWLKKTEIPGDKTRWGSFDELAQRTNEDVKVLLEKAANANEKIGTNSGNIGAFFKSGMDTMLIEKAGIAPIQSLLDEIAAIKSNDQLIEHFAANFAKGIHSTITGYIFADEKDVTNNILQFHQAGLGLPTKDAYFKTDSIAEKNRKAYINYLSELFVQSGSNQDDANKKA